MKRKVITGSIVILLISLFLLIPGCDDFNLLEVLAHDISIIPEEITLDFNETVEFNVSAGIEPFNFTLIGEGNISSSLYTAPSTAGYFTISVEDDRNRTAEAFITVLDASSLVRIIPEIVSTGINGVIQFTISGGTDPYTIDWDSEIGDYDVGTDIYTAGSNAGVDTITVTDSNNQITEAVVTILDTTDLIIIPEVVELLVGDTVQFSASGGVLPYVYSLETALHPDEEFNPVTRIYTASSTSGVVAQVKVSDFLSAMASATIYSVENTFKINPSIAITLYVGDEFTFTATNGESPYTFFILGNESTGSINSSTGLFTAITKDNNVTVVVEDSRGATDTCRVKIKD